MSSSSLTSIKDEEVVFAEISVAAVVGCNPFGGKLGLYLATSWFNGSEILDDKDVSEEEGESAEDEARETDLSGLAGFLFCLSGEAGEIPFGDSVGVPL